MTGSPLRAVWHRALFSHEECQSLISATGPFSSALVTDENGEPTQTGGKRGSWKLLAADEFEWAFARLAGFIQRHADYGFELREIELPIKVQRYTVGDFHDWHVDLGAHAGRKLGLTVQLSDPDAYEGGDLRLFDPPSHRSALRERGAATCFPSFLPHEVTPVTSGVRFSLTAWVMGPRFR